MAAPAMPYFDMILQRLPTDAVLARAFGRHVHWGYWEEPNGADVSADGYAAAADMMSQRVCEGAALAPGMRILDVGCGFGGTIAGIDERLRDVRQVGVNIDRRQLERARREVSPRAGSTVDFIAADACRLPFAPDSFDAVLAVECIFHFAGRMSFLREARRVLRPGGRLSISDWVPFGPAIPAVVAASPFFLGPVSRVFGAGNTFVTSALYRWMARAAGLELIADEDVTRHTLPTYPALIGLSSRMGTEAAEFARAARWLQRIAISRSIRYRLVSFKRTA